MQLCLPGFHSMTGEDIARMRSRLAALRLDVSNHGRSLPSTRGSRHCRGLRADLAAAAEGPSIACKVPRTRPVASTKARGPSPGREQASRLPCTEADSGPQAARGVSMRLDAGRGTTPTESRRRSLKYSVEQVSELTRTLQDKAPEEGSKMLSLQPRSMLAPAGFGLPPFSQ
jgi:hypothetical protein